MWLNVEFNGGLINSLKMETRVEAVVLQLLAILLYSISKDFQYNVEKER